MGRITTPIVIRALRVHCFSFSLLFFSFFFSFSFLFFLFVHSQKEPSATQGKTPILLLKSLFHNRYFFFQFLLVSFNNDGFSLHKSHILSAVVRTTTFVLFYIIFLPIKSSCILYLYLFLLNNQLLQNFLIQSLGPGNHIGDTASKVKLIMIMIIIIIIIIINSNNNNNIFFILL